MVNKDKLMRTKSLEEAVKLLFDRTSIGRDCIFTQEAMTGCVASEYDSLGKSGRQETYKKLAEDFRRRTGYKSGSILEVGCGSGLLALELAGQSDSVVVGLDLSSDMISLAKNNLQSKVQEIENKIIQDYKEGGYDFSRTPHSYAFRFSQEIAEVTEDLKRRIHFVEGTAYEIDKLTNGKECVDYVVCRNALHRFQYPGRALEQMYNALSPNGKIYLRDLRRDANWQLVLERIGEKRWNTQMLVQDYIGAMASMLTTSELEKMLQSLGIANFEITNGRYINGEIKSPDNIKEYEKDTEYVCVIEKFAK